MDSRRDSRTLWGKTKHVWHPYASLANEGSRTIVPCATERFLLKIFGAGITRPGKRQQRHDCHTEIWLEP